MRPWFAVAVSFVVLCIRFSPGARDFFFYDRVRIKDGQWWRLWSGHLAHHSTSHLLWNLAVFLPAAAWLEHIRPTATRIFIVFAPLFISGWLWFLDPNLQFYAGLSGVTIGVVTLLTILQLRSESSEPRQIWLMALILIAAKIAFEFRQPTTAMFAGLPDGIRNVPLAHLAGAMGAAIFALAAGRRKKPA
jgi:rhomboid family GlyGly-CTERM serine protease